MHAGRPARSLSAVALRSASPQSVFRCFLCLDVKDSPQYPLWTPAVYALGVYVDGEGARRELTEAFARNPSRDTLGTGVEID